MRTHNTLKEVVLSLMAAVLIVQFSISPIPKAEAQSRPYYPQQRQGTYVSKKNQRGQIPSSPTRPQNLGKKKPHQGTFSDRDDQISWNEFLKNVEKQKVTLRDFKDGPKQVGNSVVTEESFKVISMLGGHGVSDNFLKEKGKGYVNLMLGMGLSDLFFAVTSNDSKKFKEWVDSMMSFQNFHLNMIIFELAMLGTNFGGNTLGNAYFRSYLPDSPYFNSGTMLDLDGSAAARTLENQLTLQGLSSYRFFQQALSWAVLPMGDMISSYFSEIYHHPKMEAYRRTFDPHVAVIDPDHPELPPTNDPDVKNKVRSNMKLHLLSDIIAESNTTEKWEKILGHGMQLGLVATGYGMFQKYALMPLEVSVKDGKTVLLYRSATSNLSLMGDYGAREIYAVEGFDFAKFAVGVLRFGGKFEYVGGLALNVVGFFILDKIVSAVVTPPIEKHGAIQLVKDSMVGVHNSISWYIDPTRTEYLPWSLFRQGTREWYWLKFFTDYKGDMSSDFFLKDERALDKGLWEDGGVGLSDGLWEHLSTLKAWHYGTNDAWTMIWVQAFEFMKNFSLKYLGKPVDESSFYACQDPIIGTHAGAVPCQQEWYKKNAPLFVESIKDFKTQDYVRARFSDLNQAFNQYRGNIILGDMNATWNSWSKGINEDLETQARKEYYFIWIARGASETDPYFIENKNFWHPHVKERKALDTEVWQMKKAFDDEILGYMGCDGMFTTDGVMPVGCDMQSHEERVKQFVSQNRWDLDRSNLVPVMTSQYLKVFDQPFTAPQIEQVQTANKVIKNHLDQGVTAEDKKKKDELDVMEKNEHRLRWFLSGMAKTTDFKNNKPVWHPANESQLDQWTINAIGTVLVIPFFLNIDPDVSDAGKAQLQNLTQDIFLLLTNQNKKISDQGRDYLTLVTRTYMALREQRNAFTKKIESDNNHYQNLIKAELAPSWYQRHVGAWFPNAVDKFTNKFNMPDKIKHEYALYSPSASWIEVFDALPSGTINTFNVQLNYYLKVLSDNLEFFRLTDHFSAKEKQNELLGYSAAPDFILDRLQRLVDLLEQSLSEAPQGFSDTTVYEAAITAGQVASIIAASTSAVDSSLVSLVNAAHGVQSGEMPTTPHERAEFFKKKVLNLTARFWGDIAAKIIPGKSDAALDSLFVHKRILQAKLQDQLGGILQSLKAHGWGYASPQEEDQLRNLLSNQNFSLPLLALTTGGQALPLHMVAMIGAQAVNIENQKTFQARIGCYLLGDEVCKQAQ